MPAEALLPPAPTPGPSPGRGGAWGAGGAPRAGGGVRVGTATGPSAFRAKPLVSPLRAKGAQPARAPGALRPPDPPRIFGQM